MARMLTRLSPGALLLLCATAAAQTIEVPLEYCERTESSGDFYAYGSASIVPLLQPPEGEWVLPEAVSKTPLFGVLRLGDSELLVMLDRVRAEDEFYSRIRLDLDGDHDLTDDRPMDGELNHFSGSDYVHVDLDGAFDLEYRLGDRELPCRLEFSLSGQQLDEFDEEAIDPGQLFRFVQLRARTQSWYEGAFELDGQSYRLALGDRDCDGRFDDRAFVDEDVQYVGRYPLYPQGDYFYLTDQEELDRADAMVLGDHLLVGDRLFELGIDTAAGRISLVPLTEGLLPLELDPAPERLLVNSPDCEHAVMMMHPGESALLPPGSYRLLYYRLLRETEQGEHWLLEAKGSKETDYVHHSGSAGSRMEFAEPFTSVAEVPEMVIAWAAENEDFDPRLNFNVEGRAGELVSRLSRLSGSGGDIPMSTEKKDLPREPSYAIYTVSTNGGKLVKKDSFEYG